MAEASGPPVRSPVRELAVPANFARDRLTLAGADVKDAQAPMRHSRASTTLDLYQQFVAERQLEVVGRLNTLMLQGEISPS